MAEKQFRYHVFLSHNSVQKDWVRQLAQRLRQDALSVFFDEDSIQLGEDIVLALEKALRSSRHILLVLSPEALASQWVALELSTSLYRDPGAAARTIIPVLRTDCEIPLTLARLRYLDARSDDFESQVRHLLRAIDRVPLVEELPRTVLSTTEKRFPSTKSLFHAGGTLPPHFAIYVEREADRRLSRWLNQQNTVCIIWGPRQIGKSSLMVRTISRIKDRGVQAAFLDLAVFGGSSLPQVLFGMSNRIARDLGMESPAAEPFLASGLGPQIAFTDFVMGCKPGTVLAFDEVDYLRSIGELESFSQMLRALYNRAAVQDKDIRLLMSSFLSPHRFIENQLASPFNVGYQTRLENFNWDQSRLLFERGHVELSEEEFERVYDTLGGQPYLMQLAASIIHNGGSAKSMVAEASSPDGPFGTHLRSLQTMIEQSSNAKKALDEHLRGKDLSNVEATELLRHRRKKGARVELKCLTFSFNPDWRDKTAPAG